MPGIKIIYDTREVVKTLKTWEKVIGLESTRMPTKLIKSARRGYLMRTSKFRWGAFPPSIDKQSVLVKTTKGRKTAELSVNVPHAAFIEYGMKPHFVGLDVVGETVMPSSKSKNQFQVSRLAEWVMTKAPQLKPAIRITGGLRVGASSKGAFSPSVRAGGGPFEKSIKSAQKRADKELKNLARKLK
jgi:hypothetical protein